MKKRFNLILRASLLKRQLKKIYKPEPEATFDTSDVSPGQTAKEIARAILLKPYTTFEFSVRLGQICTDGEL
jgi:hypothetical protein